MRSVVAAVSLTVLCVAPPALHAQDTASAPSAAEITAAAELLRLMNTDEVIRATTAASFEAQAKQEPGMAPFVDVMQAWADSVLTLERVGPGLARLYADLFTEPELHELLAFYRSPLGRKVAATAPELARRASEIGAQIGAAEAPLLQRMIMERAAELGPNPPD